MKVMKAGPAVGKVKEDIDRLFDRFFATPFINEPLFPPFETVGAVATWLPTFDLSENDKEYVVRLEVPGINKENLDISLVENVLTITGKREISQEQGMEYYLWKEREFGRFVRNVRLPSPVVENKIEALCQDGVLVVRLPKAVPTPANKILIK
ncbi:MAG TPA: Hsp20/alpha crystallin family protein [Gemmatimonadales bacterium]|nr:Hsp20/alpha crystallin family protein [Gemmatimonadales bacterium]